MSADHGLARADRGDVCASRHCEIRLTRNGAVWTREGPMCKKHADRLPPYLRRPLKGGAPR